MWVFFFVQNLTLLLGSFAKVMPSRLMLLSAYERALRCTSSWACALQSSVIKRQQQHIGGVHPETQAVTDAM